MRTGAWCAITIVGRQAAVAMRQTPQQRTNFVGGSTGHIQKCGHNKQPGLPQPSGCSKPSWRCLCRQQRLFGAAQLGGVWCCCSRRAMLLPPLPQPALQPVHQGNQGQNEGHSAKHEKGVGKWFVELLWAVVCPPWRSDAVQALAEQRRPRPCSTGAGGTQLSSIKRAREVLRPTARSSVCTAAAATAAARRRRRTCCDEGGATQLSAELAAALARHGPRCACVQAGVVLSFVKSRRSVGVRGLREFRVHELPEEAGNVRSTIPTVAMQVPKWRQSLVAHCGAAAQGWRIPRGSWIEGGG